MISNRSRYEESTVMGALGGGIFGIFACAIINHLFPYFAPIAGAMGGISVLFAIFIAVCWLASR